MNILFLYGADLADEAEKPLLNGKNSVLTAIERAKNFPGVEKTVVLADTAFNLEIPDGIQLERRDSWTKRGLLECMSALSAGYDISYFAFADCPFLDPGITASLAQKHSRYAAEYSYADGWPYGLAPELLSAGTAGILAKIIGDDNSAVTRDTLFSVIQKDINNFDIEAEISSVDLRCHRLSFCADSKRNLLLMERFISAAGNSVPATTDTEWIIAEHPEILRTLPNYFPVQVYGACPQSCAICPYPALANVTERKDFMDSNKFEILLDKITGFCGDAVINLSMWGEISMHPEKLKLVEMVINRPGLALVIETSGIGWNNDELEYCARLAKDCGKRKNPLNAMSWIVSLDSIDSNRYAKIRGAGYAEARDCAKKLFSLFGKNCYVQAIRVNGEEDDTEKFYRYWKENAPYHEDNIIIQKFDDFCGALERRQASDISPVIRRPCWHIMRDMPVLIDGTVPLCREELSVLKGYLNGNSDKHSETSGLGNVFTGNLEQIWERGNSFYKRHCEKNYTAACAKCDEYYTYNF
ncbi:MAG: spiro-SPASM protein [Treponema sp.]|jgi:spiro-SPASM protein|nr:spiro-SPASM protein [Treponema sp.]